MINETKFVILPIPETFPISSYLPLSIIAAISLANQSNNEWIYLNFIQLVIRNGTEKLESFPNQDYMYFPQQNLSITNLVDENFIFDKRYLEKNILLWLSNKNYVVMYCDEYLVPFTRNYKKKHILHSQFIYGVNVSKGVFYCVNFSAKNQQLEKLEIPIKDIIEAFFPNLTVMLSDNSYNINNYKHRIVLIKYQAKKISDSKLEKIHIKEQISDYLNSNNSSIKTSYFTNFISGVWGIEIYNVILKILLEEREHLDYRMFHLLYGHKLYMKERLLYMKFDNINLENVNYLIQCSNRLRLLCIKYNIKPCKRLVNKMVELIKSIKQIEIEILSSIVM